MPELPEVETTRRGIEPVLAGLTLQDICVREPRLRWPVTQLDSAISHPLTHIERRGKYLLFRFEHGTLILHLGMSGHLRIVSTSTPIQKHDHIDFVFGDTQVLRFNDPRRFGSVHWHEGKVSSHPLLKHLGPEPLSEDFHGDYLFQRSRKKTTPVKNFIMDSHVVVGVGNIYANEALFSAHIRPQSRAGGISKKRYELLTTEIKSTLSNALEVGGTTLRDYVGSNGEPGYFSLQLAVYGRADQPCLVCNQKLKGIVIGQRQTVYCRVCQQR